MIEFGGVFSVLPTPFRPDGQLDVPSLRRLVDRFLGAGIDGVTALGVTSEVSRLTDRERRQVLEVILDQVNGRVPVVAGATAEGLLTSVELSRSARAAGAAAVMVSPPRLPKLNSEAVVRHYAGLADAVDVPIVVQDYPPISGFTMEPALLARIAREVPPARTIKLEDPPTPFKTARILEQAGETPVRILGGLGGVYLIEELMAGASGAMTGFAIPEILVQVVRMYRAGRIEEAAAIFYKYVAVMRFEFQEGIGMAIRKEMLRRRGALDHAGVRAPAVALDEPTRRALDRLWTWLEHNGGAAWTSG